MYASPGDPASWPLNQREKRSAKIVFETTRSKRMSFFDVCLDHPSLQSAYTSARTES
ncbi:hypothetical protein SERLA73DRAFT_142583, partial [Serpula lacrymans var. lacrymans S7.3]